MRRNLGRLDVLVLAALVLGSPVVAMAEDYFNIQTYEARTLLMNVEKYHLSRNNFFKLYREGQLKYATEELKFVLNRFPNHPVALQLMGSIAKLRKAPLLAVGYFERALQLYPQHAMTHAQYGAYLVGMNQVAAGILRLQKATEMEPNLAAAHGWLAEAYRKAGQPERAREAAATAQRLGVSGNYLQSIEE